MSKTKTKTKAVALAPTAEALELLKESFPTEAGYEKTLLPRLSMVSQDVTEGKGKLMKVVTEAGTFFKENQTEELNEEGKPVWEKTELGTEIEATVIYSRKQLKYYNEATELYTSSPVYDNDDEVLPLFCDKKEIDRGTVKELQAKYPGTTLAGKPKSNLEVNRVLYVLYEGEVYQMNLRGSSMYSWLAYSRKVLPPAVLTRFSSEAQEKGSIAWNQLTCETVRPLDADEIKDITAKVTEIKNSIAEEKQFFASRNAQETVVEYIKKEDEEDFGEF